jgi:hypothetical protein
VRWLGATTSQQGLDRPQLVLSFTTSADNKTSHKLTVGVQNSDNTFCALADGRDGTFAISNADFNNLKLRLEMPATASPSPTTGLTPAPTP